MSVTKTSGQITTTLSTVAVHATKRGMTESSTCVAIGTRISNGSLFQRGFPSITALNNWLAAGGDGHDVEISRIEPTAAFGG